jgi:biopolymer transport protein ExbB
VPPLLELLEPLRGFLQTGGHVLWGIGLVSVLLWTLIVERYLYLRLGHRRRVRAAELYWRSRRDKSSWYALRIREGLISEISLGLQRSLGLIRSLVAICPLLGLLGTVTGMIRVFDVMASLGSGNARAMAAGVSMATIPTMAGMVVALSGLFFSTHLSRRAAFESQRATDSLRPERD